LTDYAQKISADTCARGDDFLGYEATVKHDEDVLSSFLDSLNLRFDMLDRHELMVDAISITRSWGTKNKKRK